MKYKLSAYSIWELGQREKQEDSIFPPLGENKEQDRLFVVCDGMGGHSAGEIASKTVCDSISSYILDNIEDQEGSFTDEDFKNALESAYNELDAKDNGAEKKMGTTLTFLKLHNSGATIAHIGDSRVYHVRPGKDIEDTEILFQTYDHSLVNDLVKIGELTPEEAKNSRQKNIITRAMQPNLERRHRADVYHTSDIKPGDYFMLCTDGILEQMEDDNIKFIFSAKGGDDSNKVRMIISLTKDNRDNHSAEIVHITDVIDPIPQVYPSSDDECGELVAESTAGNVDITDPNAKLKRVTDFDDEPNEKNFFRKILDNVFKNHGMASVIIIAVAAILCVALSFLISNSKKEQANIKEDITEYLEFINKGDELIGSGKYSEAIDKYEEAQKYEEKYRDTKYSKEFSKDADSKIKTASSLHASYVAEQARLDKQRKEKEAAEQQARFEREHKEKEAAEQARFERERKEKEAAEQRRIERMSNEQETVEHSQSSNDNIATKLTDALNEQSGIPVADNTDEVFFDDIEIDGYTFKDLGLSVKWADRNVGASSSDNYGSYETDDYKPGSEVYRLPKEEEFKELMEKCKWEWKGNGYEVIAENKNKIFLPAAGSELDGTVQEGGEVAYYLASDKMELIFNSKDKNLDKVDDKVKLSVRLVCE